MSVPVRQTLAVLSHVWKNRWLGQSQYPLVLMLEPLLRCNLACAGCGKIQHPAAVLKRHLSVDQCLDAAEQCGAPIVSIPGGEPLLHPQIEQIVGGLVKLKRFIYLCTNAIKLEESLAKFTPSAHLAFSVHVDGPRELHDRAVCRDGIYDLAISAIRAARTAGFRVTTNTTIFAHTRSSDLIELFDTLSDLGVEGMMVSPGFAYEKAPDQQHFMNDRQATGLVDQVLQHPHAKRWRFNQSPLYLQFLRGRWSMDCTPWGSPTYNLFGWQRPCYLIDEGYAASYGELMSSTNWSAYGHRSGNVKCSQCMTHCGFEPTAVAQTLSSWRGLTGTMQAMLRPNSLRPVEQLFNPPASTTSAAPPLVNIQPKTKTPAA
ncbi:MAG: adenosyl-hopene transferase HpnH [Pirellulaceae bacterium]|nr:adenosyl-hopene transferase HpnH [Pirellulaceae bacterium]